MLIQFAYILCSFIEVCLDDAFYALVALSLYLSAKYKFASSNAIRTTFCMETSASSKRKKRLFFRKSIATIDVLNVPNSYFAYWS
jgi:hypothetical protein